jgi:pimeloyl-ACP methyl ester carboxylesterase
MRAVPRADWGGTIAWNTAIWYPEVVEKLITCCGAHPELYFRNMDADQKKRPAF